MKNIAMIQKGVVKNIAHWDGVQPWNPEGYDLVDITDKPQVQIGWLYDYDEETFSSPS